MMPPRHVGWGSGAVETVPSLLTDGVPIISSCLSTWVPTGEGQQAGQLALQDLFL